MHRSLLILTALLLAVPAWPAGEAHAQFARRLKDRAKQRVEQKVEDKVVADVDQAMDAALDGEATAPAGAPAAAAARAQRPGEGAWLNYDFVPGERVVFAEDFAADRVGNFPRRLTFQKGNFEIAEWEGRRFLRGTAFGAFAVTLPETLPDRFTLEFDLAAPGGWYQEVRFSDDPATFVRIRPHDGGIEPTSSTGVRAQSAPAVDPGSGGLFPVKVMADGAYVKVYLNDTRVANVPNADLGRSRTIVFTISASQDAPVFIGALRVGAGGLPLYEALAEAGRVATQGILFDTGSDVVRPESTPTLEEIVAMLAAHPDLRLRIEGHTDDVGAADANQQLSERRAEAVRAYLVAAGVDAGRLEAQGLGASAPAADNATPEGRQQNRRVELVRL